ncbi:MAG: MerR family transcriptional regulator [Lachnospiraceae bacterium]|nr:MerR family transcriptional regulator [Lachnospiraceae bacterium]
MKPTEFSKKLGIPVSTIRYYDRQGITRSERNEVNNYRDFDGRDALDIYNALLLRSFDVKLERIIDTDFDLNDVDEYMANHVPEMEELIKREQMRLARLREMQFYISEMEKGMNEGTCMTLSASYSIWTFNNGRDLTICEERNLAELAAAFPYSYVAIGIDEKELREKEEYTVRAGLGILEANTEKCGITFCKDMDYCPEKKNYGMFLEKEDPFKITRKDLEPIFSKAKADGAKLTGDAIGRMYLRYRRNGKIVYGLTIGIPAE